MKIEQVEVFILSDRNTGARMDASFVDGFAFVRLRTSDGIVGISEIFAVPPKVAQAVLDGKIAISDRPGWGLELRPDQFRMDRPYALD